MISERKQTLAVHGRSGQKHPLGAVNQPVFQSSTFRWTPEDGVRYIRFGNTPNQLLLGELMAAIEKKDAGLVTASGQASISAALMTALGTGDHLLVSKGLYGGTIDVVRELLPRLGISWSEIDPLDPNSWQSALTARSRALYCEALTSPLCRVPFLDELSGFSRAHGLTSIIDNTNPGTSNFCPADLGFDVVVHSLTKYIGGHSDVVAGCLVGTTDFVEAARNNVKLLGAALDPNSCFLVQRGLKTLDLRLKAHNENALRLAEFLDAHSLVRQVHYPGLSSNQDHARGRELFNGFGALVTFDLEAPDNPSHGSRLLQELSLPMVSPSFGGPETLIIQPALTTQANLSDAGRREIGVSWNTIRVAVGLEASDDLIEDFRRALDAI